jgi:predicted transposase YdaD
MGHKDLIGKDLLRHLLVDFANILFELDIDPERLELLQTESPRIENRESDFLARVHDRASGAPYLLHIELQDSNDPHMPLRMMRYYTDIQFCWPGEPLRQYLIYLGKQRLRMSDDVCHPDWRYCYTLLDIRDIDCETLIARDNPDALVMAILCDFGGRPTQAIVNRIVQRLRELTEGDDQRFRRYFDMLEVLSGNRDLKDQVKEAEDMLKEIDRTQLPSYELGLEDGIEKGIEKGRQEGRQEGRFEGRLAVARKLLTRLSDEEIADSTGLAIDLIRQLRSESSNS